MALEREHAAYENAGAFLLGEGKKGKFVLIHGQEVAGIWDTWEEAAQAGYDRFKLGPFPGKQIADVEKPRYFSRNITTGQVDELRCLLSHSLDGGHLWWDRFATCLLQRQVANLSHAGSIRNT